MVRRRKVKMSSDILEVATSKVKRKGRVSNKRDKRLDEVKNHKPGDHWSEAKRMECAMHYIVLGSATKVQSFTGVPSATIAKWRQRPWWEDMVRQIRDQHNDELDAKMTGIMNTALESLIERLEEGDTKFDTKTGDFYKLPIGGKDVGVILSIIHEKRSQLRATPNSLSNDMTTDQRLDKLGKAFLKFAAAEEIEGQCEVVIEHDED